MLNYMVLALAGLPVVYILPKVVWYFTTLQDARRFAATSPLPSVTIYSPRDHMPFWLISSWIALVLEPLPFGWGHWIRYVKRDFSWITKGDLARNELKSDAYWTVGPGGPHLYVGDAEMNAQIVHRWKDFQKPIEQYGPLELFGTNVVTTEGADWQRHRKITGPPFNERNSSLVFRETLDQGRAMLRSFTHNALDKDVPQGVVVEDLVLWTMTVALNVISGAGFNLSVKWPVKSVDPNYVAESSDVKSGDKDADLMSSMSVQQSLNLVANYAQFLILFPASLLRKSPFQWMRDLQQSSETFVAFMQKMIAKTENTKVSEDTQISSVLTGDLLGSIVRAGKANKSMALNEDETIGNLFIFIMAGHETTASTLQTGLILLAMDPEYQKTVQDEIDEIWSTKKPGEDWSYDDYAKMRTLMALMLETLRLYPPVVILPKTTRDAQTITYREKTIYVPPNTSVTLDIVSVQRNPRFWGADAQECRPSRWLMPRPYTAPPNTTNESTAHADLLCPTKGAFIAFSAGFRGCLGKKFAQVEFCTLIAVLLQKHSIELVREDGQSWEDAKREAQRSINDRSTTLAMRMNGRVKVKFVKRGLESFPRR